MGSMSSLKPVHLILWDPTSDDHVKRMYDQRVSCSWDYDLIDEWKESVLKGTKFLYWIVLQDTDKDLLDIHVEKYENERLPLKDKDNKDFIPIGHIALEKYPDRNAAFQFDPSTLWVKTFYISWTLQKYGLGRSSMHEAEQLAKRDHSCAALALDTVMGSFHSSEMVLSLLYDARGIPRPPKFRSNEAWYLTQGYKVVEKVDDERVIKGYDWKSPSTGEIIFAPNVYMIKLLE